MTTTLNLLCAGAAEGLVKALQDRFETETGATLQATFGAVGAMKEALLAGQPCDLMILTATMVDALCADRALVADTQAPAFGKLGSVATGIAVQRGQPHPDVDSADTLRAALLAAKAIYFPDPLRATAGIHFADVMRRLGVHDELQPRFRNHPNGAASMRELAAAAAPGLLGCTQVTEILHTPGVELVAPLPAGQGLATVYSAAVSTRAAQPALAAYFIALLTGAQTAALRAAGGFSV